MCRLCDEANAALAQGPKLAPAVHAELTEHIDTHCAERRQPTGGQTLPAMTTETLHNRLDDPSIPTEPVD